jgi:flagellar motor switch/type III secretory pathway protein FliN
LLLLQVDNKMLVVRCGSVLLAVDQHAADERVQLEALQEQLAAQLQQQRQQAQQAHPDAAHQQQQQQAGAAQKQYQDILLQRQRLVPGLALQLTIAESKALAQHEQQVKAWGWQVLLQESAAAGAAGSVNASALLQQVPVIAGVQLGTFDLQVRQTCACRR